MADGAGLSGFLGVSRSLSGRAWRERPADPALVRRLAQQYGLSELIARAMAARGIGEAEAGAFLNPTLKGLFPDPSSFLDMDLAAEILIDALVSDRKVAVFADYDVDGASSAALLIRWFRTMGKDLALYVPDRMTEGYGPSPAAFRSLKAGGADLVVTVDCGAAATDAIDAAAEIGLDVVVIDHHLMRGEPPRAAALVNPNRPGCNSGQGVLAAAGVTFVLLAALNREARRRGLFAGRPEPDLRPWLDLAAMGAICDVTQLVGFNRALASQGLKVMSGWANPGLAALMSVARSQGPASPFHVGFVLGPRINAGGRIGRSDLGARLLSTDNPAEAAALAEELDALNISRKDVERQAFEEAAEEVERGDRAAPVILVAREGWHPGVVGIVAGRLRERFRRPAIVVGLDPATAIGKGSGRSQAGVNLGRAVQAAYDEGLLLAGGGHAMAAGLTIRAEKLEAFGAFLADRLGDDVARSVEQDCVEIDFLAAGQGVDRALYTDMQRLAPFGQGNSEPLMALADVRIDQPMAVRGGHVRCTVSDGSGGRLRAVSWRSGETELGRRLLSGGGGLHLVCRLKPDDWQGRNGVELEIEDVADPRMCS